MCDIVGMHAIIVVENLLLDILHICQLAHDVVQTLHTRLVKQALQQCGGNFKSESTNTAKFSRRFKEKLNFHKIVQYFHHAEIMNYKFLDEVCSLISITHHTIETLPFPFEMQNTEDCQKVGLYMWVCCTLL